MKVIWLLFLLLLIGGLIFGAYNALFTGNQAFSAAATANNETFTAEISTGWPTMWFVLIFVLVIGVLYFAIKR